VTIRPASDRSLLVSFGAAISLESHHQVFHLTRSLEGVRGILNLHPAYASVLIEFDPRLVESEAIEALVHQKMAMQMDPRAAEAPRTVEIPVRYGGEFGPDLDDVARHAGLSPERVVELHSAANYLVYFLGFAPGFAYLGGLPPELATPRIAAPRKHVPAGSVGIGGNQTGVYPIVSPGGWRLIGRTSVKLFDPSAAEPVLLRMGDRLRFVAEGGAGGLAAGVLPESS
jgi:KipI family sensor histidine kinase inhibitor